MMNLEVWSDVACSWCYIGKHRLETALARFEHADKVNITWRSFDLDPMGRAATMMVGKTSTAEFLSAMRGISLTQAQEMQQAMTNLAAVEGLELRFERLRSSSTFDAHRLMHLARVYGCQSAVKERFFRAYFTEGELITQHATLCKLAAEAGLPEEEIVHVLANDDYADAVREDEKTATSFGVQAVPFFLIDGTIRASGALPPEALLLFLQQGWAVKRVGRS